MKQYSEEKQRELWNKYKAMGRKKFMVRTTLASVSVMLLTAIIAYLLFNYLFEIPNYSLFQLILSLIIISIMAVFNGVKMSNKIWDIRTIKFDGIAGIITEVQDNELKDLILKGEKIMAAKRYRQVTGGRLKEAIRYVDLISEYYSYTGQP